MVSQGKKSKGDIQGIRTLLLSYNGMNGSYPDTLSALVPRFMEELPKDAYGLPYVYRYPGRRNPASYDLFSAGTTRYPIPLTTSGVNKPGFGPPATQARAQSNAWGLLGSL